MRTREILKGERLWSWAIGYGHFRNAGSGSAAYKFPVGNLLPQPSATSRCFCVFVYSSLCLKYPSCFLPLEGIKGFLFSWGCGVGSQSRASGLQAAVLSHFRSVKSSSSSSVHLFMRILYNWCGGGLHVWLHARLKFSCGLGKWSHFLQHSAFAPRLKVF